MVSSTRYCNSKVDRCVSFIVVFVRHGEHDDSGVSMTTVTDDVSQFSDCSLADGNECFSQLQWPDRSRPISSEKHKDLCWNALQTLRNAKCDQWAHVIMCVCVCVCVCVCLWVGGISLTCSVKCLMLTDYWGSNRLRLSFNTFLCEIK